MINKIFQYGHACKFDPHPPNKNCLDCYKNPDFSLILNSSVPCWTCFLETHDFNVALNVMFTEKKRPTCSRHYGPRSKGKNPFCDKISKRINSIIRLG